jgi:hypothetical protein
MATYLKLNEALATCIGKYSKITSHKCKEEEEEEEELEN